MEMEDFIRYLRLFQSDNRLTVWHLALLMSILDLGYRQGNKKVIMVSRSKIMALSHINTIPTYNKYFKELQSFGYIKYTPSYHPGFKSKAELLK